MHFGKLWHLGLPELNVAGDAIPKVGLVSGEKSREEERQHLGYSVLSLLTQAGSKCHAALALLVHPRALQWCRPPSNQPPPASFLQTMHTARHQTLVLGRCSDLQGWCEARMHAHAEPSPQHHMPAPLVARRCTASTLSVTALAVLGAADIKCIKPSSECAIAQSGSSAIACAKG